MSVQSRLAIATEGFRGGTAGTIPVLSEFYSVTSQEALTVTRDDPETITLPSDVVLSLDDTPYTVAQLDAFVATKAEDLEVTKEE
jgi:hypothetical protein